MEANEFKIDIRPKRPETLEECTTIVDALKYYGAIQITKDNILFENGAIRFQENSTIFQLEVLAVVQEYRGKGYGKRIMECLIECSNVINKPIILTTGNIYKSNNLLKMNIDCAGYNGSLTKGKIPVRQLPAFYSKFSFITIGTINKGTQMIYYPKIMCA